MNYRIECTCDPYNARNHYNGEEVLQYNMMTPVRWVIESGFATLDEAKDALMRLAKTGGGNESGTWEYIDEDFVRRLNAAVKEKFPDDFEDGEEPDASWFKGEGIYESTGARFRPILLKGETSFRDDVLTYSIEEY